MLDADFVRLLELARSGDEAAIGELLRSFEDDVRMMVRVRLPRALRNQFDSMDFVQAVWQSVLSGKDVDPSNFSSPKHFRGYLAGMARNKVFEEFRRRTQTRKYDVTKEERLYVRRGNRDEPRALAAHDPSASEQLQADDCLDRLVAGRSPEEVEVVELRRQGLTFEEIAERTGMSERGVRRIIDSLRPRLEDRRWP